MRLLGTQYKIRVRPMFSWEIPLLVSELLDSGLIL